MGAVIIWPSSIMPTMGTWLECNGQSTASYPELAAIVGVNVPDYRGVFLRGFGSQTSTHYGTVTHSSAALGMLQGDAIRNITGTFTGTERSSTSGVFYANGSGGGASGGINDWAVGFDAFRVVPTDVENRPINKAVRYLIKAQ